jgi:hypothetical protein
MGFGLSILLSALGAILAFAVHKQVSGISVHTIGWILMIVGIVGGLISMIFWQSWAGPGYLTRRRTTVDEPPAPATEFTHPHTPTGASSSAHH